MDRSRLQYRKLAKATPVFSLFAVLGLIAGPAPAQDIQTTQETQIAPSRWMPPACNVIAGTSTVTFTRNEGQTLALTPPPAGTFYTTGLVALEAPNTLLASTNGVLLRSTDAGCTWSLLADPREETGYALLTLTRAGGERAYAWADNGTAFLRIDGERVTRLKATGTPILGVGVDPANPDRVRIGDEIGQIWESADAGETWAPLGTPATEGLFVYRVAFDPADLDHILVGTMVQNAFHTADGARSWTKVTGFSIGEREQSNVFSLVISPVDPQVVWAMAIDMVLVDRDPNAARAIYRSVDGGLTFTPVVRGSQASIQNGPTLAAHPADSAVVYWAFGMSYMNYGTDLYRYDAAAARLTSTHNAYHGIRAIDFSPVLPEVVMYLGPSLVAGH